MSREISTAVSGLSLRPAQSEDVPVILQFIRELAEFEHLTHEVVADESSLQRSLFGPRPMAEVVIADYDGSLGGFALFFPTFSTFVGRPGLYLEDLYVRPHLRGRGIGSVLVRHLAQLAVERGCGRFEWAVLDWNSRAIDFYEAIGAVPMKDWMVYRLSGPALSALSDTVEDEPAG